MRPDPRTSRRSLRRPPLVACPAAVLVVLAAALAGCASPPDLVPAPPPVSDVGITHFKSASEAHAQIQAMDLASGAESQQLRRRVLPYLEDAKRCDIRTATFIDTLLGETWMRIDGASSDEALNSFRSSISGIEEWWPYGSLGIAACLAARGDAGGAEAAIQQAEKAIVKLEERITVGADLPLARNFFQVIGLLPQPKPVQTNNAQTLEFYFAMAQEMERWHLALPSVGALTQRQLVQRLKARVYLLRSALTPEGEQAHGPTTLGIEMALSQDPNFIEARFLKARAYLAAVALDSAWANLSPYVQQAAPGTDAEFTSRQAAFLRLAANVAREYARRRPNLPPEKQTLHGHDPFMLAEALYADVAKINPNHGRALTERADNLLTLVERDPGGQSAYLEFVDLVLEQAKASNDPGLDQAALTRLVERRGRLR